MEYSFVAVSMEAFARTDVECHSLLVSFLSKFGKGTAWWYPIMPDVPDNLSSFLGLDYHLRYIPLLCKCGLVKERVVKGEKTYMVCQTASAGGYCWSAFFAEFNLHDFKSLLPTSNSIIVRLLFYELGCLRRIYPPPLTSTD